MLREASAATSQTLCSAVFVSGLDPDQVFREQLRPEPGMGLVAWALRYTVDDRQREVRTRIAGTVERTAAFRAGRGCTLRYPGLLAPSALRVPAPPPESALVPGDAALVRALDGAFAEPKSGPLRGTKALVVLHAGAVIAERYAAGYGVDTPVLGHSLAKSLVNALVGILVQQGKLTREQPAPIAAWKDDPKRAHITIDQLLRMNAGFGFDEGAGSSAATQIWFTRADTAAASAEATLDKPGWGYSSRSYALLSRILGDVVGGGPQGLRDFAERELFAPLGMRNVTLEFDQAGTMMGAQAAFATPRDWARFGALYLDDGVVAGRRILPAGWVAYSMRPTEGTGYGAGFWLNNLHSRMPAWRMDWGLPSAPPDAFFARGYLGQYIVIVPSAELVIMRAAVSNANHADAAGVGQLTREVITALQP